MIEEMNYICNYNPGQLSLASLWGHYIKYQLHLG